LWVFCASLTTHAPGCGANPNTNADKLTEEVHESLLRNSALASALPLTCSTRPTIAYREALALQLPLPGYCNSWKAHSQRTTATTQRCP
jgi:hypothetical protein